MKLNQATSCTYTNLKCFRLAGRVHPRALRTQNGLVAAPSIVGPRIAFEVWKSAGKIENPGEWQHPEKGA